VESQSLEPIQASNGSFEVEITFWMIVVRFKGNLKSLKQLMFIGNALENLKVD
jgi:hypothetical protein